MKPIKLGSRFAQWMLYATGEGEEEVWLSTTFNGGSKPSDEYVTVYPGGKERYSKKPRGKRWELTEDACLLIEERRFESGL